MNSRLLQIQEMLKTEPDDAFLNYALALEFAKINNFKKSVSILNNLISKETRYLGAYYQLGKLYEQVDQINKAKDIYQKGIELAKELKNQKTLNELKEALSILD